MISVQDGYYVFEDVSSLNKCNPIQYMICVELYIYSVQFDSKIFSAKPKEFIGRQTDHRWWDLGLPGGFMGRIWRPGDHISAAL